MQEKVNKFSNIKERIIYFVENQKIKKEYFFTEIGLTSANFRGKAKNTPLNSSSIENIITKYPQLNLQWLITGKGQMILQNETKIYPEEVEENQSVINEPVENYGFANVLIENQQETITILKREVEDLRNDKNIFAKIIEKKLL